MFNFLTSWINSGLSLLYQALDLLGKYLLWTFICFHVSDRSHVVYISVLFCSDAYSSSDLFLTYLYYSLVWFFFSTSTSVLCTVASKYIFYDREILHHYPLSFSDGVNCLECLSYQIHFVKTWFNSKENYIKKCSPL